MKIYLASSFSLIPKIKRVVELLELFEIGITVRWWERLQLKMEFAKLSPEEFYAHPECKFAFERDYLGIQEADAVVLVADDTPRRYNGANIEVGIAYALGKPVFSVGVLENSAMYYKVKRCSDISGLIEELRKGCASEKKIATFENLNMKQLEENGEVYRGMIDKDKEGYRKYSTSYLEELYHEAQGDISRIALAELLHERRIENKEKNLPRPPRWEIMQRRFTI
jgi:nucleoside 2-deoxyribosyltransferase